jgi:uncharacterized protein YbjT (DUF2867 family)
MTVTPILVTGATGKQGGATARRLLAEGRPVRALVRNPVTLPGVDVVRGDLDDPASLPAAFEGVEAVFAIPPTEFGRDTEFARAKALIDAAATAGVKQVVFSTVASTTSGTAPKAEIERYLFDHIELATVLRPVRFMTNYLGRLAIGTGIEGIVDGVHRHLFPPHEPMQIIALEDIAEFAALAFADPARYAGRTLELAGDQPTPVEAVATIAKATGIPIRYELLSAAEAAAISPVIAESSKRWNAGSRWHADIEALRVIHPGLRTLTDWLEESGAAAIREHLTSR